MTPVGDDLTLCFKAGQILSPQTSGCTVIGLTVLLMCVCVSLGCVTVKAQTAYLFSDSRSVSLPKRTK